jgi:hypothetical protein
MLALMYLTFSTFGGVCRTEGNRLPKNGEYRTKIRIATQRHLRDIPLRLSQELLFNASLKLNASNPRRIVMRVTNKFVGAPIVHLILLPLKTHYLNG